MKILRDTLLLVGLFVGCWILLSQVDFMKKWHIQEATEENEKKLGDLVLGNIEASYDRVEGDSINQIVFRIADRILTAMELDTSEIRILVHDNTQVNAFALPGNTIVINTGLIEFSKSPEELAGVIGHEIGHLELSHISKRLAREVGVSMITLIATGGGNFEIIGQVARTLLSTNYSREQESASDKYATEAMAKADMNPQEFANILFRFTEKSNLPPEMEVMSTHPNPADRSSEVLKMAKKMEFDTIPIFEENWETIKANVL